MNATTHETQIVADREPRHDVPPGGIGQCREHPGERICHHFVLLIQPFG